MKISEHIDLPETGADPGAFRLNIILDGCLCACNVAESAISIASCKFLRSLQAVRVVQLQLYNLTLYLI